MPEVNMRHEQDNSTADSNGLGRKAPGRWFVRARAAVVLVLALTGLPAWAQTPVTPSDELFFQQAAFRIPFTVPPEARVYQAKLFLSLNKGDSWEFVAAAKPNDREFTYTSNKGDGSYWFAVQTITPEGGAIPPEVRGTNNNQVLRVVVDSRPPTVQLSLMHGQDGSARADWEVYDEHLRIETLTLEYRIPPGNQWYPVSNIRRDAKGSQTWPAGNQPIEIRMSVQDRAGNIGRGTASTTNSGSGAPSGSGSTPPGGAYPPPQKSFQQPDPDIKYVKSQKITLRYDVSDVGKSGIKAVEVWRKTVPGGWGRVPYQTETIDNNQKPLVPITIDLGEQEGLFGFTLIAKSGVDVGLPAPTGNDAAQLNIRVDRTPPVVKIQDIAVGKGVNAGRVTITWDARDKDNLMGKQCITIYNAAAAAGPWTPIHSGKLDNIGQYVWPVSPDPDPKLFFKVEAEDWAGNVGSDVSKEAIIEQNTPRVQIQGFEVVPAKP
jgi:hypothetical protein